MRILEQLKPQPLFNYFEDICQVPRPSKKEEKIRHFLLEFAQKHGLPVKSDNAGNVLISKPAYPGREKSPVVILQTHMDMVCEKNSDKVFDFDSDPIEPMIVDGWVKANGTTLGADCGIGMAAQMAVLTSKEIKHGPVECLITVDEETGLTGAFALKPGFMSGSVLLNLDSEDEGEIFIGCAGGIDTVASIQLKTRAVPKDSAPLRFSVTGLLGGHSGDDIHKNRGNAIKILNRFLWKASRDLSPGIADFDGGNLRNAIAREASAVVVVPQEQKKDLLQAYEEFSRQMQFEYERNEPNLKMKVEKAAMPEHVLQLRTHNNLLNALYACPHGILEMSTRMEGMVETSTNLASVKFVDNDIILISTSQRSELESRKHYAAEMVRSVFELTGATVTHSDGYPGWTPNPDSKILKTAVESYKKRFGTEPVVRSIHAGLECGLFLKKYPNLDMVSFGPTIKGAHSPDERLDILTTGKFWLHLVDILENIK
jgi:dipeptidase D